MRITAADLGNWVRAKKPQNPKTLRFCGTTGRYLHPTALRRCPHGCEPLSWRDYCRVCGEPTISRTNDD